MNKRIQIKLPKEHAGQLQILSEAQRFNVVDCGRRWGKSVMATNLLANCAINGLPAGYFTPTYKLLNETFNNLLLILDPIIKRKNDNQFIELITGGKIEFWSLENELAGRSRKYKLLIVDEASFTKNLWQRWTESLRATLSDLRGDAWFFSTPKGKNDFYKLYVRGLNKENGWMAWKMPTSTNPFIHPDEIEDAKRDMPADAFAQEYMAEFNENASNPFGRENIEKCIRPLSNNAPVCFGIDLAKSSDWSVIIGLDAHRNVCYFDRFQNDWGTTMMKIKALPKIPMLVDSTGVGDPIVEQLQSSGMDIEGFKFTSTSKQELMKGLQVAIHEGAIGFPDGIIANELDIFEFQYSVNGVKYSAPSGFHDDAVMALALANRKLVFNTGSGRYSFA